MCKKASCRLMCKGSDGFAQCATHNLHACAVAGNCIAQNHPASLSPCGGSPDDVSCSGRQLDIDTQKPILFQVGHFGPSYLSWVHRPVPGPSRFFHSSVLESLTRTPWWVVPLLWGPAVAICFLRSLLAASQHWATTLLFIAAGVLQWQLLEYCIHRHIFHAQPVRYWPITFHFAFHGCHHKFPTDRGRLVFPPLPAALIAAGIHAGLRAAVPQGVVLPMFTGVLLGYLSYDCIHYALHHAHLKEGWLGKLKRRHLDHHFRHPEATFGISSAVFDVLLHSMPRGVAK